MTGELRSRMQPEFLIAVLAGLGGMAGWGVADFFAKKTIDALGDVPALFWSQCIGIVPLTVLLLVKPTIPQWSMTGAGYVMVLGIWSGLSYIPTYVAFGKGKVSLLSPIFASYAVVVTILSAVILHEKIPIARQLTFCVVFLGIVLITGDLKALWLTICRSSPTTKDEIKGLREILLAVGLYSLWLIALDRLVNGKPWVALLLGIRIFTAASLLTYALMTRRNLRVVDPALWTYLGLVGLFDVGAFGCVSWGFSATRYPSVVAMLSGAFSLPTIILARVFLKERTSAVQTAGSFVVVLGILLLYVL
jgi:drug/metabolite transporter (DMT)-like permease